MESATTTTICSLIKCKKHTTQDSVDESYDKYRMCYKGHFNVSFNNFKFIDATPKGLRAALQASSLLALQKYEAFWRYNNTALYRLISKLCACIAKVWNPLLNKTTVLCCLISQLYPQSLGFHRNGLRALCSVEHVRERERESQRPGWCWCILLWCKMCDVYWCIQVYLYVFWCILMYTHMMYTDVYLYDGSSTLQPKFFICGKSKRERGENYDCIITSHILKP